MGSEIRRERDAYRTALERIVSQRATRWLAGKGNEWEEPIVIAREVLAEYAEPLEDPRDGGDRDEEDMCDGE
jgi:hypothetical protein